MQCVQEGKTRDSTGNTGSTGSEHGNMHRLGKGQGTRDYYIMNNRKKGRDLATTEFGCGTRFRDSRRWCGRDNCGCRNAELAVLVSNVTWVLRDVTVSNFTRSLSQLLGIRVVASMAYHPQTDGQTERVNQEVEQFLRLFVNQWQDDWYEWLAIAEFAYNDWIHASMRSSPFMMDMGQNPRLGIEPLRESRLETLNDFASRMDAATKEAHWALSRAADDMARFYDAHRREAPLYAVGYKVWLNGQNITTTRLMKKPDHKWLGPYPVDKVISWSAYRLKLPSSFGRTHPVFSVTLL